jgi:hypothetical protein
MPFSTNALIACTFDGLVMSRIPDCQSKLDGLDKKYDKGGIGVCRRQISRSQCRMLKGGGMLEISMHLSQDVRQRREAEPLAAQPQQPGVDEKPA